MEEFHALLTKAALAWWLRSVMYVDMWSIISMGIFMMAIERLWGGGGRNEVIDREKLAKLCKTKTTFGRMLTFLLGSYLWIHFSLITFGRSEMVHRVHTFYAWGYPDPSTGQTCCSGNLCRFK